MDGQLLALVGLRRFMRLLFRIIVVRFLFHTLGFGGAIALLLVVLAIALFFHYRRRR